MALRVMRCGCVDATMLTLELKPEDISTQYRQQWTHDFILTLTITLGDTLCTHWQIDNPNPYPLSFTLGFHTYLAVDDIHSTEIHGLTNLRYQDNLRERATFYEDRACVTVADFIDRCYQNIPESLVIKDTSTGRTLLMTTQHCRDAFVWNPWHDAEKNFKDLAPSSYQKFICVEPGNMITPVKLAAGACFHTEQTLKRL
jgi:glucose-6-phosphate 1-epimerase